MVKETKNNHTFRSGFTIVELLIVIVVLGILAVISVVSYNGIQERARDTQIKTLAGDVGKALRMQRINGIVPERAGYFTNTGGGRDTITPEYLPEDFQDGLSSKNSNSHNRIHRYYLCGEDIIIYAALNNPSDSHIQNFNSIKSSCGHTDTHAPTTGDNRYNYARRF